LLDRYLAEDAAEQVQVATRSPAADHVHRTK
jgi:hypothetical protein